MDSVYRLLVAVFILGSLSLCTSSAIYSPHSTVIALDKSNFETEVMQGKDAWVVEYYTPICDACKSFVPEYEKVANSLRGVIKIGALNCNTSAQVCWDAKVTALPAIKGFSANRKKNPYTKSFYKEPVTFDGKWKARSVIEFASELMPAVDIENLTGPSSSSPFFSTESELPKVVLFSREEKPMPLFKALALKFKKQLLFALAASSNKELATEFAVDEYPSLHVIKVDKETVAYSGDYKLDPLVEFLGGFAVPLTPGATSEKDVNKKEGTKPVVEDEKLSEKVLPSVDVLEGKDLEAKVMASDDAWLIAFTSNEEACRQGHDAWRKASTKLTNMIRVAELNVDIDPEAASLSTKYGAEGSCPTLVLFPFGDDKEELTPVVFSGKMEGKEISQFVQAQYTDEFVQQINEKSMEAFAGNQLLKPKILLFSAKYEVSNVYRTLATNFRRNIHFAQIHESEKSLLQQFHVTTLPAIRLMLPEPSEKWKEGNIELQVKPYVGPMKYAQLALFMREVEKASAKLSGLQDGIDIPEVVDDDTFAAACINSNKLCVVGLVKDVEAGKSPQLDVLRLVAARAQDGGQFSFSWINARKHAGFAGQLGISPSSLPTAAVLSPAKKRFVVLQETLTGKALAEFLSGILAGKVRTALLEVLPSFTTPAAAEEQELVEEPIEEEYSLEDVLGEEVEDTSALNARSKRLEDAEKELAEEQARLREIKEEAREAAASAAKKKKKKKKKKAQKKDEL